MQNASEVTNNLLFPSLAVKLSLSAGTAKPLSLLPPDRNIRSLVRRLQHEATGLCRNLKSSSVSAPLYKFKESRPETPPCNCWPIHELQKIPF